MPHTIDALQMTDDYGIREKTWVERPIHFPEILGIARVVVGQRDDLVGLALAVAQDDIAMEVVAVGAGSPLEADEGGELARRVVFLGCRGNALPNRLRQGSLAFEGILEHLHRGNPFVEGIETLPDFDQVVDLLAPCY